MEISEISGLWSNIKKYDKTIATFHLQHSFKKGSVFSEHVQTGFSALDSSELIIPLALHKITFLRETQFNCPVLKVHGKSPGHSLHIDLQYGRLLDDTTFMN